MLLGEGGSLLIVTTMPAAQKQLIHALQIAAHKMLSAPDLPLSPCYVTDRERRGEWDCACAQNLNTCCFVLCGKLTNACVLKAAMADWNRSNHFDTPCIYIPHFFISIWMIFLLYFSYSYSHVCVNMWPSIYNFWAIFVTVDTNITLSWMTPYLYFEFPAISYANIVVL